MSTNIVDVTSDNWDAEVVQCPLPVLVDFWAVWCGPCVSLFPTLESLAEEHAGRLKIVKVNSDHSPDLCTRLGVRGVPHLMLMKAGVREAVVQGRTRTRIAAEVEPYLDRRGDAPRARAEVAQSGAWGGDPARKQASIATARAALATVPVASLRPRLKLATPGTDGEVSNVYCAAYGTDDPAVLEARAGLPASTLMLASAALRACERWGATDEGGRRELPLVEPVVGAPVAALEAIRVGADPLAIARSYVVELLGRLETLRDHDGRGLTPEPRALLSRLATLHRDDCSDPALFRELRREAMATTDGVSGEFERTVMQAVEALAWPLAGLTDELPEIVGDLHMDLVFRLSPEQPSPEDKAIGDAANALARAVMARIEADPTIDADAEFARLRASPEFAASRDPAVRAREMRFELVAAEAYAPFAIDVLLTAFRKA